MKRQWQWQQHQRLFAFLLIALLWATAARAIVTESRLGFGSTAERWACDLNTQGRYYGIYDLVSGSCASPVGGGSTYLGCVCSSGTWVAAASGSGTGTVTSVAASGPASFMTWSSAVTTAGTLTATLATQAANTVLAGPTSGGAATPTNRALVTADMPAGTGTVTSVACGTGLTGGTITTTGTCAASFGTTSTTIAAGNSTNNGPPGSKFDIVRLRTDLHSSSDNFNGSISASWTWQDQGGATDTYNQGRAVMVAPANASSAQRVRCLAAPTATDYWVGGAVQSQLTSSGNRVCGAFLVVSGTEAVPTRTEGVCIINNGGTSQIDHATWTSYAGAGGAQRGVATPPITYAQAMNFGVWWYLRFRYVTSTKVLTSEYSINATDWTTITTTTLAQDPISVCRMVDVVSAAGPLTGYWRDFRTCSSATCTTSPFPWAQ